MLRPTHFRTFLRSVHPRANRRAGFTLVEIMAVVALISITAALATPSFVGMLENRRVQKDGLALLASLQDAKSRAVGRGGAVRVTLNSTATRGSDLVRVSEIYDDLNSDDKVDVPSYSCGGNVAPRLLSMTPIGEFSGRTRVRMDLGGDAFGSLDLCFTPRGSVFVLDPTTTPPQWRPMRNSLNVAFQAVDGAGDVIEGRRERRIMMNPTGDARMML
jgi:prepilin-type N-terminal cleavage/methylation domain-containing protein